MSHITKIKQLLLECGFTENDFENIKNVLLEYYKHYLKEIEKKIELFVCNKRDFYALMKIALEHHDGENQVESDSTYNIYDRYFGTDEKKLSLNYFDLYDYWTGIYNEKRETPDEELFNRIMELL